MAGWNGSGNSGEKPFSPQPKPAANKSPAHVKGILAGAVVVLGGIALLFFSTNDKDLNDEKEGRKTKLVRDEGVPGKTVGTKKDGKKTDAVAVVRDSPQGTEVAASADDSLSGADLPKMDNMPPPPPPPIFTSPSDQLIAMAVNSGDHLPPMPYSESMDEDFRKALKTEIVIADDDPAEVKAVKQAVIEARAFISEQLEAGKSVKEVLEEHREKLNYAESVRRDVIAELNQIYDSGDVEGAKKYLFKMNLALQQMGIGAVEMPESKEERIAKARERAAARKALKEGKENEQ